MQITIVLPERRKDALSDALCELTEAIHNADPDRVAHGLLGGSFGYGGHWDDAVFMMHPFCWCDRSDCAWCNGCDCPAPTYFVEGKEATLDEWLAAYHDGKEREADEKCAYCKGEGVWSTHGAERGRGAPNFWHKPSGLKVWWYKYIGRDMEIMAPAEPDIEGIFAACKAAVAQGIVTRSAETSEAQAPGAAPAPRVEPGGEADAPEDPVLRAELEKWQSAVATSRKSRGGCEGPGPATETESDRGERDG